MEKVKKNVSRYQFTDENNVNKWIIKTPVISDFQWISKIVFPMLLKSF